MTQTVLFITKHNSQHNVFVLVFQIKLKVCQNFLPTSYIYVLILQGMLMAIKYYVFLLRCYLY